jgi:hypothetical protein
MEFDMAFQTVESQLAGYLLEQKGSDFLAWVGGGAEEDGNLFRTYKKLFFPLDMQE